MQCNRRRLRIVIFNWECQRDRSDGVYETTQEETKKEKKKIEESNFEQHGSDRSSNLKTLRFELLLLHASLLVLKYTGCRFVQKFEKFPKGPHTCRSLGNRLEEHWTRQGRKLIHWK